MSTWNWMDGDDPWTPLRVTRGLLKSEQKRLPFDPEFSRRIQTGPLLTQHNPGLGAESESGPTPLQTPELSSASNCSSSTFCSSVVGTVSSHHQRRNSTPKINISSRNMAILTNAVARNPHHTRSQSAFLAACLEIEDVEMETWRLDSAMRKMSVPQPIIDPSRSVGRWRHKIIERISKNRGLPSYEQICFLADGLRLHPRVLRNALQDALKDELQDADQDAPRAAQDHNNTSRNCPHLQADPPSRTAQVPEIAAAQVTQPFLFLGPELPGWKPIHARDTPTSDPKSADKIGHQNLLEEQFAAVLGPEYAHIMPALARLCSSMAEESSFSPSSSVACDSSGCLSDTSGDSSYPRSTTGHSSTSFASISSSSSGSQKRKYLGNSGGDGGGDGKSGDGDEGGDDRQSKRAKNPHLNLRSRFDCPIARRAMHVEMVVASASSRACAPGGLEFRNVWDHMTKAHFGCETCDKSLSSGSEALQHMFEKNRDPQTCQPTTTERKYEIGIEMWMKLEQIYKNKHLDHHKKWIGWWNLLCPGAEEPDPLHHDTISLSTADIPRVQQMVEMMWESTPSLPVLSTEEKVGMASILDKVLRLLPRVSRPRRQRRLQGQERPQPQFGVPAAEGNAAESPQMPPPAHFGVAAEGNALQMPLPALPQLLEDNDWSQLPLSLDFDLEDIH